MPRNVNLDALFAVTRSMVGERRTAAPYSTSWSNVNVGDVTAQTIAQTLICAVCAPMANMMSPPTALLFTYEIGLSF